MIGSCLFFCLFVRVPFTDLVNFLQHTVYSIIKLKSSNCVSDHFISTENGGH